MDSHEQEIHQYLKSFTEEIITPTYVLSRATFVVFLEVSAIASLFMVKNRRHLPFEFRFLTLKPSHDGQHVLQNKNGLSRLLATNLKARLCSGCIFVLGKGHLHFCAGSIKAERRTEILEPHILP